MLATLRGRVRQVAGDHCVLEVNGVGFQVFLPLRALEELSRAEGEVLLHTYLHHKDDAMALYGFLNPEEKALFYPGDYSLRYRAQNRAGHLFRAVAGPISPGNHDGGYRRPAPGSGDWSEERPKTDPGAKNPPAERREERRGNRPAPDYRWPMLWPPWKPLAIPARQPPASWKRFGGKIRI